MPAKLLKDYLDNHNFKYIVIQHSPAYTAQEIAAAAHVPGKEMAKTVMVNLDGRLAMCVLPASYRIDMDMLMKAVGASSAHLASEEDFRDMFPGCEVGAMPPFGNLYNKSVYVAERLMEDEEIVFNAGTHTELIRMKFADYAGPVKPHILKFATTLQTA